MLTLEKSRAHINTKYVNNQIVNAYSHKSNLFIQSNPNEIDLKIGVPQSKKFNIEKKLDLLTPQG